jgi:hypothetical protein
MVDLLKMVIFHGYVKQPEGKLPWNWFLDDHVMWVEQCHKLPIWEW